MKKDYKLYNMIFPMFMLVLMSPVLWLFSIVGNFIIDGTVLLIISFIFYKKFSPELFRKSLAKVYFLGFLADFIGAVYMTIVFLIYELLIMEPLWGLTEANYRTTPEKAIIPFIAENEELFTIIIGVAFIISSLIFVSGLIFIFNYKISFKETDMTINQKITASLIIAIITTPYTYFIPTEFFSFFI